MKTAILSLVFLSFSITGIFSQENPWLPKGENPWGHYEKVEKSSSENEPKKENPPTVEPVKKDEDLSSDTLIKTSYELYQQAVMESTEAYKCQSEFVIGCAFAVLTITGIVPTLVTVAEPSKKEKKLIEEIESKPEYQSLDKEKLNRNIKKAIKRKKLRSAMQGVAVGLGVKALTIYVIITGQF